MLMQEDFVAPKMSVGGSLRRSSWKAEAIRRGDLKISGPIPITEETPLTEEEEMEHARKLHTEPPSSFLTEHVLVPPTTVPQLQPKAEEQNVISGEDEAQQGEQEHIHELRRKSSSANLGRIDPRESSEVKEQSFPQKVSYSTSSPLPSIPRRSTVTDPKKRKGSLRNVIRKMFGRRSRETPQQEQGSVFKHGHHRSEPITVHESPKATRENLTSARISDLPVRELAPINPLAQHLPFPMNVNAPQELSPPHKYLDFQPPPTDHLRRRATLPNVLALTAEAGEKQDDDSVQSPQIGVALSSPPPRAQSRQSKRRSRSAGAVRDLAKSRPSVDRRRSAEIQYWRSSYQSASVYSTISPRPETARTVETIRSLDAKNLDAEPPSELTPEAKMEDIPKASESDGIPAQSSLPVGIFNFGDLNGSAGFPNEDQALGSPELPTRSERRLSIDERVKHLEDTMRSLETSVRRVSGRSNRHTIILESAPTGQQYRSRSSPTSSERQGSYQSSKGSGRTLSVNQGDSGPPSPTLVAVSAINASSGIGERPQTVVALESDESPLASTAQLDLAGQLAKFTEALRCERTARKALEQQVDNLQREVANLHALVNKIVVGSPSYPTPSPDAIITSNEERLATPRAASHGHHLEPEAESPGTLRRVRETIISRFSHSDDESEDYSVTSSREDIASPEAWATPKEESGFGSGFFTSSKENMI